MFRQHRFLIVLLLVLLLVPVACNKTSPEPTPRPPATPLPPTAEPTPTPTATPSLAQGVVISEILAGVKGNNNLEFVELYNAGEEPVDLQGWSLWYRLRTSEEDLFLYRFREHTLIPGHGHVLLVHEGEDVGVTPNGVFTQALNVFNGGLELRRRDGTPVDRVAWGKGPAVFTDGDPAVALENGKSLERLPGGEAGNGIDSDDNAADFALNPHPNPQNSGSPLTPAQERLLSIRAEGPSSVVPGTSFTYTVTVENHTGGILHKVRVRFPLPRKLEPGELPESLTLDEGVVGWEIDRLGDGESHSVAIPVTAPFTYLTAVAHSYTAQAVNWPQVAVGGPVLTDIAGGVIPIAAARELMGAELTVEGVATMYTGGFYAGGGNTKFYLRDETGGLQVQVFTGEGVVNVHIGDRVRVHGVIGAYRGAAQIVPNLVPDDIEILQKAEADTLPEPYPLAIADATDAGKNLPGELIQVEGKVTRVEEFTYSYEIDLQDEVGNTLTLYVDKLTNISVEGIKTDHLYRASGILEVRDGVWKLYPRVQSDLREVFPPVLLVEAAASHTVMPGAVMTYTAAVFNHTTDAMTNVHIEARLPAMPVAVDSISEGGVREDNRIVWTVPELPGDGGRVDVSFTLGVSDAADGQIVSPGFSATSDQWTEPATSGELVTFVGSTVPIWAVQGDGMASPYVLDWLPTGGVVTAVFPDLGGFFIQSTRVDDNPLTSEGLFVNTSTLETPPQLEPGDVVEVFGQVRETAQQTQILVEDPADIRVLDHDAPLPRPVDLDPPATMAEAEPYFEAREGMLVQLPEPAIAVSPTSKYGEYVVTLQHHGRQRLWQGEDNGIAIMVDDGSTATHLDRSTLPYVVATGDIVEGLVGPLAYTYGRYKIEPIAPPSVQHQVISMPSLPLTRADEFSIMTWNVENLFDTRLPHPSDPPLPTRSEYELALTKVANTIVAAGVPTIVALQEVENIGVLEDIAEQPVLRDYGYQAVLIEGTDSRGIDVGYLVRGDRAQVLDSRQFVAPEGLTSRPPLLIKVQVKAQPEPLTVYVLNNHFSSMSGGVAATEPRRTAQAAWNVRVMYDAILADEPDARVAVVGDLNSFYDSLPINTLREAGLIHVMDELPREQRYTYIYQGESQVLDHILVTRPLHELLTRVDVLHVDADYPPPIPGDPSPLHKSDHDPLIARFTLAP